MTIIKSKYNKLNDEQLMKMIQRKNYSAFGELYERYAKKLLNYFYRMLNGNEQKAQDFLQDLFTKIIEKPVLFNTEEIFSSWVYAVAFNMCKNEYRRIGNRKTYTHADTNEKELLVIEDKKYPIDMNIDMGILHRAIFCEINNMDIIQKSTFILRFQIDLSIKEISKVLNCSEGTVKSRLYYITRHLANKLKNLNPHKNEV